MNWPATKKIDSGRCLCQVTITLPWLDGMTLLVDKYLGSCDKRAIVSDDSSDGQILVYRQGDVQEGGRHISIADRSNR